LEASAFEEMKEWEVAFGEGFPLSSLGIASDTKIPGFMMFSQRAIPLAAWMSGLELGFLQFEGGLLPRMRLETGASDSWILANLTTPQMVAEAKHFEESKKQTQQVHFLAIQSASESASFAGFWLLKG
jgi:RNA-binding protein Tab2/Atab2